MTRGSCRAVRRRRLVETEGADGVGNLSKSHIRIRIVAARAVFISKIKIFIYLKDDPRNAVGFSTVKNTQLPASVVIERQRYREFASAGNRVANPLKLRGIVRVNREQGDRIRASLKNNSKYLNRCSTCFEAHIDSCEQV